MIVADRRRLEANKAVRDIFAGDFVRRVGHVGIGFVEEIEDGDQAWVAWKGGRRDLLPLSILRRINGAGHDLDARRRWEP